jgi:hypothetical protein
MTTKASGKTNTFRPSKHHVLSRFNSVVLHCAFSGGFSLAHLNTFLSDAAERFRRLPRSLKEMSIRILGLPAVIRDNNPVAL